MINQLARGMKMRAAVSSSHVVFDALVKLYELIVTGELIFGFQEDIVSFLRPL
jgi:hypothetical protein